MTNIARGLAALTIFVVAGFTAGCGSADAPTTTAAAPTKKAAAGAPTKKAAAPVKAAPSKTAPSKTAPANTGPAKTAPTNPRTTKTSYCVPLAKAQKARPAFDDFTDESQKNYGTLLKPAVSVAMAAGRTDVGKFLSLTETISSNPSHEAVDDRATAAFAAMKTAQPIILRDCGIDMLK